MSFFTSVESFLAKEGQQAIQYAQGLVTTAANHPQASITSGADKHAAIVEEIKKLFQPALSAFGKFAHDAATFLVHRAFDLVSQNTPQLLQPLLAPVEAATESAVANEIDKDVADVRAALLKNSPFGMATAPVKVPGINVPLPIPPTSAGPVTFVAPPQQSVLRPIASMGESSAGGSATGSGP